MKKLILLAAFPLSIAMFSCEEPAVEVEKTKQEDSDTTAVAVEEEKEEETTLAFNGVDKGEYTLYGHKDMDAQDAAGDVEMLTEHEITGKFTGKVAVKLSGVCKKAGCWVTFPGREGEGDVRVVFKDHFTIPTDTPVGTEAILLGSMVNDTISVAMQKHYLDDAKEAGQEVSQEEYDAITEDKVTFTFDCESILVKK